MTSRALALKVHPEVALVASTYILLARTSHMAMCKFKGLEKYNLIMS